MHCNSAGGWYQPHICKALVWDRMNNKLLSLTHVEEPQLFSHLRQRNLEFGQQSLLEFLTHSFCRLCLHQLWLT